MKNLFIVLIMLSTIQKVQSQSKWFFDKTIKTTKFLGTEIKAYNRATKTLEIVPGFSKFPIEIDTVRITNSEISEFESSTVNFFLGFFSLDVAKVTSVKMYNPIQYTLSYKTIKEMPNSAYYVYTGQSADSVEFNFALSRKTYTDIKKILDIIATSLTAGGVNAATLNEFIPLFDSSRINSLDTLNFKYTFRDPNALFRVQVLKKQNTKFDPGGKKYALLFPPIDAKDVNDIPDSTILEVGEPTSGTQKVYPEFGWFTAERNNVPFRIVAKRVNSVLSLGVEYIDGGDAKIKYFTPQHEGDKTYWHEEGLVYAFSNHDIKKMVYVSIYAKKISDTKILVINWQGSKVTYMTYPEIRFKYLP